MRISELISTIDMQRNIDNTGKAIRLITGAVFESIGLMLIVLPLVGKFPGGRGRELAVLGRGSLRPLRLVRHLRGPHRLVHRPGHGDPDEVLSESTTDEGLPGHHPATVPSTMSAATPSRHMMLRLNPITDTDLARSF